MEGVGLFSSIAVAIFSIILYEHYFYDCGTSDTYRIINELKDKYNNPLLDEEIRKSIEDGKLTYHEYNNIIAVIYNIPKMKLMEQVGVK